MLGRNYAAGPSGADLFDLRLVAVNTGLLLLSSITYGFAMLEMDKDRADKTLAWLAVTGVLGAAFLGIELYEFAHLIHEGATPQRSAFLSSFFTLGTMDLNDISKCLEVTFLEPSLIADMPASRTRLSMSAPV